MARPAKFDRDSLLDAALVLARDGPGAVTVAALAEHTGAPTGSIYHRFESIDALMAELWLRTVEGFQTGFVEALAGTPTLEAAVRAARFTPAFARAHPAEASLLLTQRRDALAERFPDRLGTRLRALRAQGERALSDFVRRHFRRVSRRNLATATFALVDAPYGAVRRHLVAPTWRT